MHLRRAQRGTAQHRVNRAAPMGVSTNMVPAVAAPVSQLTVRMCRLQTQKEKHRSAAQQQQHSRRGASSWNPAPCLPEPPARGQAPAPAHTWWQSACSCRRSKGQHQDETTAWLSAPPGRHHPLAAGCWLLAAGCHHGCRPRAGATPAAACPPCLPVQQALQQGQAKGGGLAAAGDCRAADVAPRHGQRYAGRLDGGGVRIPQQLARLDQRPGQAQVRKVLQGSRGRGAARRWCAVCGSMALWVRRGREIGGRVGEGPEARRFTAAGWV